MKLYVYAGEALSMIVPIERRDTNKLLDMHNEDMPRKTTRRVVYIEENMSPEHQVRMVELVLAEEHKSRNIQLFTHSPYVVEAATVYGRKYKYDVKYFHVVYTRANGVVEPVYEDPEGNTDELIIIGMNKALDILDKVKEKLNTKAKKKK